MSYGRRWFSDQLVRGRKDKLPKNPICDRNSHDRSLKTECRNPAPYGQNSNFAFIRNRPCMSDRQSDPFENDNTHEYISRYEKMLEKNDEYFFDVEQFELIIDHYLDRNELKKASQVLGYARSQHPTSVELLFCESNILIGAGKLNKALQVLDAMESLHPFNDEIYLTKASIHSQLRNYDLAIRNYKKALEFAEEELDDIHVDLAFEYENLEALTKAIFHLKEALKINPENEAALYELAYCFDLAENMSGAATFFQRFLDDNPYSYVGWYSLGNAFAKQGLLEKGIDAFEFCIAINDGFSSAWFGKAKAHVDLGQLDKAIESYQETLEMEGAQAVTFSLIGECYEKLDQVDLALEYYSRALEQDPEWVDAWIGTGVVKQVQGKLSESINYLQKAIELEPNNDSARTLLARVYVKARNDEAAMVMYETVHQTAPENLEAWLEHSDLLLQAGIHEAAINKLEEGARVHLNDTRYRYRMVSYLLQAGRTNEALLMLGELISTDAKDQHLLFEHFPEAQNISAVMDLIDNNTE